MSSNEPEKWEEWQLTAYLLGELDPDLSQRIAVAAIGDPALAKELTELGAMLDSVRSLLQHEPVSVSDREALAKVAMPIAPSPAVGMGTWSTWLTLAAILMIALTLYGVRLSNREQQQVAHKTQPSSIEGNRSKTRETLGTSLEQDVAANSQPANESAVMFGDTQIEIVDDLDLAIVKGAQRDVQSTLDGIEKMRKELETIKPQREFINASPAAEVTMNPGSNSFESLRPEAKKSSPLDAKATGDLNSLTLPRNEALAKSLSQDGLQSLAAPRRALGLETAPQGYSGAYGGDGGGMMGPMGGGMGGMSGMSGMSGMGGMGGMGMDGGFLADAKGRGLSRGEAESRAWRMWALGEERARLAPGGDKFAPLVENSFKLVSADPLSTFSIDVDTASFSKARQYLLENHVLPPRDAVRVEEFINYFDYEYDGPRADTPFGAALAVTDCPWQPEHKLVRIALQATKVDMANRPKANLVFLLDVSGSMAEPNKLPLVKETIRLLTYQLRQSDRVALVVYAGAAGCVLESTPGNQQDEILSAISRLSAGGSTNGGQGIELAYRMARENFVPGGINRVILCTDGDFNVGVTNTDKLVELVAENAKSKVFLTVLGYGMGNTNDAMMEKISDRGNGVYGFVDSRQEAQRQMVKQLAGNLITVAKDVKIQVEFNPTKISAYRLIGYENRALQNEDFNNDKKDAGEIGAGHCVTALYQVVPVNASIAPSTPVDELRYQPKPAELGKSAESPKNAVTDESGQQMARELLAVKLRYKQPEGDESRLMTFPLEDRSIAYSEADRDFRWAAAIAEFGMLLRGSQHKGHANWSTLLERATSAAGVEPDSVRAECLEMIRIATTLSKE